MVYNCLLVGEADFSFTYSLILGLNKALNATSQVNIVKNLNQNNENYSIISTCYDSSEITFNKYQDCYMRINNINKIAKNNWRNKINVNICYNVNVLNNLIVI